MHDERFSTVVGGLVFPEGLRWRRDRLWFTDVEGRRVYCCDTNGIDLGEHVPYNGNDLAVDSSGRAYYGSVGAPMDRPSEFAGAGSIVLVDSTGAARTVADGLSFPNGMVLTPDGSTLIVAESVGRCVTTFRVIADGSLSDRSLFAMLDTIPD